MVIAIKKRDLRRYEIGNKEQGSIMIITVIVITLISVVVATCIQLATMQLSLSQIARYTNNTYYLAEEGVSKQVDVMNKALQMELSSIIKTIGEKYIGQITKKDAAILGEKGIEYKEEKIKIKNLNQEIEEGIYDFLEEYYIGKQIQYKVQSDHESSEAITDIRVKVEPYKESNRELNKIDPKKKIKVIATATTYTDQRMVTVYDKQKVSGIVQIDLPLDLKDEIREYYAWDVEEEDGQKCLLEVLDAALVSFSDVIVKDQHQLLVASGDMLVKGIKQEGDGEKVMAVDTTGGVIVKNGGKLRVQDNLCVVGNIVATNGWGQKNGLEQTLIEVGGDAIAYTMGIISDKDEGYFNSNALEHSDTGAKIMVHKNVMVDNDVLIDRYMQNCKIEVAGTIFGTSGMADETQIVTIEGNRDMDPNASSSILAQGRESVIQAERMIVGGQAFVTLEKDGMPLRLLESIGAPFEDVDSIEEYKNAEIDKLIELMDFSSDPTPLYLAPDSPLNSFISGDKIRTNLDKSYALATISANGRVGQLPKSDDSTFHNVNELWAFLFQGGSSKGLSDYTVQKEGYDEIDYIIKNSDQYYTGSRTVQDAVKMYDKIYKKDSLSESTYQTILSRYSGVKAYNTAMRSAFYGSFKEDKKLNTVTFDEVIEVEFEDHEWTYETPIHIQQGGEVDITQYYIKEEGKDVPYPSIIINTSYEPLSIYASERSRSTFSGIIISKGPVLLGGSKKGRECGHLTVIGTVIVGGPEETRLSDEAIYQEEKNKGVAVVGSVILNKDSNILFKVEAKERGLYRQILDSLKLTQYKRGIDLKTIMGPYNAKESDIAYKEPKLKYTVQSYLQVDTSHIGLKMISRKKEK